MKKILCSFLFLALCSNTSFAQKIPTKKTIVLPSDLELLLPALPKNLLPAYLKDAETLQLAWKEKQSKHEKKAKVLWKKIPSHSPFADIALFELATLDVEQKNFRSAKLDLQKIIEQHSDSTYFDESKKLLEEVHWGIAIDEASMAVKLGGNSKKIAFERLLALFTKTPWKQWPEREDALTLLLLLAEQSKSPLLAAIYTEYLNALPQNNKIRQQLVKKIGEQESKKLQTLGRFKGFSAPQGVKPISQDAQLFEAAMELVLQEKWKDATDLFQKILQDFPATEHIDRINFWIANTLWETGEKDKAQPLFQTIIKESPLSYYAFLSAQKISFDLKSLIISETPAVIEKIETSFLPLQLKILWRTRALLLHELHSYASKELEYFFQYRPQGIMFGQSSAENSLLVAKLYFYGTYYLGSFSHSYFAFQQNNNLIQKENLLLFFPRPFEEEIQKASADYALPTTLIRSVIKQESGFIPSATSKADAQGLMQLLPSTAKEMDETLNKKDLFTSEKNIKLGSQYLKKLLERFSGSRPLALAAYNAGPQRAQTWQKKLLESTLMKKDFRSDVFVDWIPYQETRRYVGNIMRNEFWYTALEP